MEKTRMSSDKVMDAWDCNNIGFEEKGPSRLSWPPKHYTCSFCRRIYKSAQALGGHMNVHRRDRAMLRQPSSWVVEFPNPNPCRYPKYPSSSSPSASFPPYKLNSSLSPSLITYFSSPSPASTEEEKMPIITGSRCNPLSSRHGDIAKRSMRAAPSVGKLKGFAQEDHEFKVLNNGEIVSLDLKMELLRDTNEGLDLELRLGYS